jgi:hypothetical protein
VQPHQRQEALARLQAGETQADIAPELRGGRHDDRAAAIECSHDVADEGKDRGAIQFSFIVGAALTRCAGA